MTGHGSRTGARRTGLALVAVSVVAALAACVPACSEPRVVLPAGVDAASGADADVDAGSPVPAPPGRIQVEAAADLRTGEDGTRATFTVRLGSRPTSSVIVPVASSNEGEVKVDPSALSFSPEDWSTPKTVTAIGQNDDIADGDRVVSITLGAATSADARFNGLRGAPVTVTNADDDVAGVQVSPPLPAASTTEAGGTTTFTVRLRSKPEDNVTIGLTSTRPTEGMPDQAALVFTASNWNVAQTVTVTGKDDPVADGDQSYAITLSKAQSLDPKYAAIDPPDVALVNLDDDVPGFFVSPPMSAKTTEAGGTTSFTVRLRSKPTADVKIPVSSSKPLEGQPSTGELTFTPLDYDQVQTVTITGQNDDVDDGDQAYAIVLGAVTSADGAYAGLDPPDVSLTNEDDDTAAVLVGAPAPGTQTTESGGQVTFTVALASEPTADVTIGVSSSKDAEGTPDVSELVFTAANWNVAQTVTVTGQDDDVDDGNVGYSILLAAAQSLDAKYAAIDPPDVALTNVDDDAAGISVGLPSPGTTTTESGAQITVDVVLQSQPLADVTIPVSVSRPAEASADKNQLVFTSGNWNVAQTITVTGKPDDVDDGDQGYDLVLGAAASADGLYAGRNPPDVALTNIDIDTAGLVVSAPAPSSATTETGGQVTFTVALRSKPLANVTVPISSTKPTEGKADKAQLVFTSGNWSVAQTVTVTGQPDNVDDDDQSYAISLGATTSGDGLYAGLTSSVALTNLDACGNGNLDGAEQCDDGNATKCDGCESCERRRWLSLPANASASVPSIAAALPVGDLCVEAWARVLTPPSGDAVLVSSTSAGTNSAFLLRCQNTGAGAGRLVFATETASGLVEAVASGTGCSDGAWHHFAGCRKVSGATVTNTVFLDGVLRATASGSVTRVGANTTVIFGGVTYASEGLAGAIDEVRISNVVRYTANFTPVRRHTPDASTLALWHLDEGAGTTFGDASGNGYSGTLGAGASWAIDTGYNAAVCQ